MAIVKISDLPLVDAPVEGTDLFVVVQDNVTKKAYASDIQTYVGFEEVQTATAGQTVFNLTQITYAAGANNLQVFVDGVNQYEGSSYTETDNNTVTFSQGLHEGALVKFSTVQTQTSLVNNAGAVVYNPAGTGAVPTNVQAKLRETVSVKDFGAVGDGVTDDTAAIQAALNASNHIFFPAGTYSLGNTSGGASIFTIDANGGAFSIKTDGVVKFTVTSASTSNGDIFKITNANGVVIDDLEAQDLGFAFATQTGVAIVNLQAQTGKPVNNVTINSLRGYNVYTLLRTSGNVSDRVSNVNVGAMYGDTCYYGLNAMYQGDNINVDALYFKAGQRSLFVYGTRGVKAKIYSTAARAGSSDVLISVFSDQVLSATENVDLNYTCVDPVNVAALVLLQAIGEGSKRISNVNLVVDINSSTTAETVKIRAFDTAGVENFGVTNNVWDDIRVTGRINASSASSWFSIDCQPSTKGYMDLDAGLFLTSSPSSQTSKIASSIRTYFFLWGGGSFTPVLTGTISAGVGTYTTQVGRYSVIGDRLFFDINLSWSAHTGTGSFVIDGLPINCRAGAPAAACAVQYANYNVGSGYEMGALVGPGSQVLLYQMDPTGASNNLLPVDSAGSIRVSGSYLI